MPRARTNGLEIEWDDFGSGPPILLVMGIGAQMIMWPEEFCEQLAARGFRVIRFDHRDIGKSTWLDHLGVPHLWRNVARGFAGWRPRAPYLLADMADDIAGLLDALDASPAHVVGVSMGGMIAQTVALEHPGRVRSLTSIMSCPGPRWLMLAHPRVGLTLLHPAATTREEAIEHLVGLFRQLNGPVMPYDPEAVADMARRSFARGTHVQGFLRHNAAIWASGDRTRALRRLSVPTLVMHGTHDPLIRPIAGRATAFAIPGARLHLIEGMGHSLPRQAWPELIQQIVDHCEAAEGRAAA